MSTSSDSVGPTDGLKELRQKYHHASRQAPSKNQVSQSETRPAGSDDHSQQPKKEFHLSTRLDTNQTLGTYLKERYRTPAPRGFQPNLGLQLKEAQGPATSTPYEETQQGGSPLHPALSDYRQTRPSLPSPFRTSESGAALRRQNSDEGLVLTSPPRVTRDRSPLKQDQECDRRPAPAAWGYSVPHGIGRGTPFAATRTPPRGLALSDSEAGGHTRPVSQLSAPADEERSEISPTHSHDDDDDERGHVTPPLSDEDEDQHRVRRTRSEHSDWDRSLSASPRPPSPVAGAPHGTPPRDEPTPQAALTGASAGIPPQDGHTFPRSRQPSPASVHFDAGAAAPPQDTGAPPPSQQSAPTSLRSEAATGSHRSGASTPLHLRPPTPPAALVPPEADTVSPARGAYGPEPAAYVQPSTPHPRSFHPQRDLVSQTLSNEQVNYCYEGDRYLWDNGGTTLQGQERVANSAFDPLTERAVNRTNIEGATAQSNSKFASYQSHDFDHVTGVPKEESRRKRRRRSVSVGDKCAASQGFTGASAAGVTGIIEECCQYAADARTALNRDLSVGKESAKLRELNLIPQGDSGVPSELTGRGPETSEKGEVNGGPSGATWQSMSATQSSGSSVRINADSREARELARRREAVRREYGDIRTMERTLERRAVKRSRPSQTGEPIRERAASPWYPPRSESPPTHDRPRPSQPATRTVQLPADTYFRPPASSRRSPVREATVADPVTRGRPEVPPLGDSVNREVDELRRTVREAQQRPAQGGPSFLDSGSGLGPPPSPYTPPTLVSRVTALEHSILRGDVGEKRAFSVRLSTPEKFSGEPTEDFLQFKCKVNHFVTANCMSAHEKAIFLPTILADGAFGFYRTLTQEVKDSYEETMTALEDRYGPEARKSELFRQLFEARQAPGQSVSSYANEFDKLANALNLPETDAFLVARFVDSLWPPELKGVLTRDEPRTLSEAIRKARLAATTVRDPTLEMGAVLTEIREISNTLNRRDENNNIPAQVPPYPPPIFPNSDPPRPGGPPWCRGCQTRHPMGQHVSPAPRPPGVPPRSYGPRQYGTSNSGPNRPTYGGYNRPYNGPPRVDGGYGPTPHVTPAEAVKMLNEASRSQGKGETYCMWHRNGSHMTTQCRYLLGRASMNYEPRVRQ